DGSQFTTFADTLEKHFGLRVLSQSGRATASDGFTGAERTYTKQLGWIITAEKVPEEPRLETLDLANLEFSTDPQVVVRERNGRRPRNGTVLTLPEFKLVSPNYFEIVNPRRLSPEENAIHRTRSVTPVVPAPTSQTKPRRDIPTVSPAAAHAKQLDEIHENLRQLAEDAQERRLYRRLRTTAERQLHENGMTPISDSRLKDAENIVDDIIIRLQLGLPGTWTTDLEKIKRRIEAEIPKIIRKMRQDERR
ncbi:MAG: hypothetical protein KGL95_13910, partial [Patescibacteria group bacterium]|nr:hypothetical protein [Patescibacteria group bacterium]